MLPNPDAGGSLCVALYETGKIPASCMHATDLPDGEWELDIEVWDYLTGEILAWGPAGEFHCYFYLHLCT